MNDGKRFRQQLRNELTKLFARPRTYLGFFGFGTAALVVALLLKLPLARSGVEKLLANNGFDPAGSTGGLTVAAFALIYTTTILGSLYLALVSGDLVAKEAEEGTLRMVLSRPVERGRIFILKALTASIYTFALVAFMGLSTLLVGAVLQGGLGKLVVFAPLEQTFGVYPPMEGLARLLLALAVLAVAAQFVSAFGLMLSCFPLRPATATVTVLSVVYLDFILRNIPQLAAYRRFFLSYHLGSWIRVLRFDVPWEDITFSLVLLLSLTASCWIIGSAAFASRDFKS